jgi:hypothetical protein
MLVINGTNTDVSIDHNILHELSILQLFGVVHLILVINQLDAGNCPYSEQRYHSIVSTLISTYLKPIGYNPKHITTIPISGLMDENITKRTQLNWYHGPTLIEAIDHVQLPIHRSIPQLTQQATRMTVLERNKQQLTVYMDAGIVHTNEHVTLINKSISDEHNEHSSPLLNTSHLYSICSFQCSICVDPRDSDTFMEQKQLDTRTHSKSSNKKQPTFTSSSWSAQDYLHDENTLSIPSIVTCSTDMLACSQIGTITLHALDLSSVMKSENDIVGFGMSSWTMIESMLLATEQASDALEQIRVGDILCSPLQSIAHITTFRLKVIMFPCAVSSSDSSSSVSLLNGDSIQLCSLHHIPLSSQLMFPNKIDTLQQWCIATATATTTKVKFADIAFPVKINKLLTVLNKSNGTVTNKKPSEFPSATYGTIECSCSSPRPIEMYTQNQDGRMAIIKGNQLIAFGIVIQTL